MLVYQGRCGLRLGLVVGTLGWAGLTGTCDAQTKANMTSPQGTDQVERAFLSTLETGRPLLVAITSRNNSEPRELWKAMLRTNRARELASRVQLVELVAEDDPASADSSQWLSLPASVFCGAVKQASRKSPSRPCPEIW